jgi:hypothetical protein
MIYKYCSEDNVTIDVAYDLLPFSKGTYEDGVQISPDEPGDIEVWRYNVSGHCINNIISEYVMKKIYEEIYEAHESDFKDRMG